MLLVTTSSLELKPGSAADMRCTAIVWAMHGKKVATTCIANAEGGTVGAFVIVVTGGVVGCCCVDEDGGVVTGVVVPGAVVGMLEAQVVLLDNTKLQFCDNPAGLMIQKQACIIRMVR